MIIAFILVHTLLPRKRPLPSVIDVITPDMSIRRTYSQAILLGTTSGASTYSKIDPDTLNKVPKEKYQIQAELARMRAVKAEKRKKLEEKAKELGITPESVNKKDDE